MKRENGVIKIESLLLNRESICSDGRHLICDRPTFSCHKEMHFNISLLYQGSQIKLIIMWNNDCLSIFNILLHFTTAKTLFTHFLINSWYSAPNIQIIIRIDGDHSCCVIMPSNLTFLGLNRYNLINGASVCRSTSALHPAAF